MAKQNPLKTLLWLTVLIVLSPLILVLIVLGSILGLGSALVNWVSKRRYLRSHRGSVHLFVTRRHGWGPFVDNNLLPHLPSSVHVHWHPQDVPRGLALLRPVMAESRPFVIIVDSLQPTVIGLHHTLLPLKHEAKRDAEVADRVAQAMRAQGFPRLGA